MLQSILLSNDARQALTLLRNQDKYVLQVSQGHLPSIESSSDSKIIDCVKVLVKQAEWLIGDEFLLILEQGIEAACRSNQFQLAEEWLALLRKNLPFDSKRLQLLQAQIFEAQQKWLEASQIYDTLLQSKFLDLDTPHELGALLPKVIKRKVCLYMAQSKETEGVNLLVEYLDIFPSDVEAWSFLATIYRFQDGAKQLDLALFSLEELMLLRPLNYEFTSLYAETLQKKAASLHAKDDKSVKLAKDVLQLSRKYYLAVLELSPNYAKALRGVVAAQTELKRLDSLSQKTKSNEPEPIMAELEDLITQKLSVL